TYSTCGHHSPLILRKTGAIDTVPESNLPLGLGESTKYQTSSFILQPGDQMFLFTDGFTDAVNSEGVRFGDKRLVETIKHLRTHEPDCLVPELMKSIDAFAGSEPQFDDMTAL